MRRYDFADFYRFAASRFPAQVQQAWSRTVSRPGLGTFTYDSPYFIDLSTSFSTVGGTSAGGSEILVSDTSGFNAGGTVAPKATVVSSESPSIARSISSFFDKLVSSAPQVLTAYTAHQQLNACAETNKARLSQGLAPVDCSSFAPQVQVGVSQPVQNLATFAMIGLGVLGLLFILKRR